MKLLGWRPSRVTYIGGYEDNKRGKARERARVRQDIEAGMQETEQPNPAFEYVTHSEPLAAAGHPCDEEPVGPCGTCNQPVPTCAACGLCRGCHAQHRIEHLLGLWATWQLEVDARTSRLLQGLSGAELLALAAHADHHPRLAGQIRWEQSGRYSVARMAELGCDSYCPAHDCASENCPPGAHD
jgi:hypothetical protein